MKNEEQIFLFLGGGIAVGLIIVLISVFTFNKYLGEVGAAITAVTGILLFAYNTYIENK